MRLVPTVLAALAATTLLGGPAQAAGDQGLYGGQDPTYDGAFRQSLAILALTTSDRPVPPSAVRWLKAQQCAGGGFEAYRADPTARCQPPNADAYSGQDTNSTALAAAALSATGEKTAAKRALKWLRGVRNPDRGWAYYPAKGASSDTNSTGLVVGSMLAVRGQSDTVYLRSVQARCAAKPAQRGGFAFDRASTGTVNDMATAQATWGLTFGMAERTPGRIAGAFPRITCKNGRTIPDISTRDAALSYLARQLTSVRGALPNGMGGTSYAGAAYATIALANQRVGAKSVKTTSRFLRRNLETWVRGPSGDQPGSLGLLILVADATGADPTSFGGTDLIRRLQATRTR